MAIASASHLAGLPRAHRPATTDHSSSRSAGKAGRESVTNVGSCVRGRGCSVKIRRTQKLLFATAVLSVTALVAAGCGSGAETGTDTSPAPSASPSGAVRAIAAQVPGSVKANGALTVAAD